MTHLNADSRASHDEAVVTVAVPIELWHDVREVVLKAPCRHVDEFNSLACANCIRVRRAVRSLW